VSEGKGPDCLQEVFSAKGRSSVSGSPMKDFTVAR